MAQNPNMSLQAERQGTSSRTRQVLFVLGTHRSGTSALAGLLDLLGCQTPANPIPKLEENPKGFFESRHVARFNDTLMSLFGLTWDKLRPVPDDIMSDARLTDYRQSARDLLQNEFGAAPIWVLKDPRLCRTFPFWSDLFTGSGRSAKVIFTLRHPKEVAQSLRDRNGFTQAQGILLWLIDMLQAEHVSRGHKRAFTTYHQLLQDPIATLERLGQTLDIPFPKNPAAHDACIIDFLDKTLRHHKEARVTNLRPLVREVFMILERWSRNGESAKDHSVLDQARGLIWSLAASLDGSDDPMVVDLFYHAASLLKLQPKQETVSAQYADFLRKANDLAIAAISENLPEETC